MSNRWPFNVLIMLPYYSIKIGKFSRIKCCEWINHSAYYFTVLKIGLSLTEKEVFNRLSLTKPPRHPVFYFLTEIFWNLFVVCFFGFLRPTREFFTHLEMSILPAKGCNLDSCSALMATEQWGLFRAAPTVTRGIRL